jgi:hypothetical protein
VKLDHIRVYTRNVPGVGDREREADVVARWERNVSAELAIRGLTLDTHQIVFALDLLQLERLCVPVAGTEHEPSRHTADAFGITWLRQLIDLGFEFVWGPEYIRLAREDEVKPSVSTGDAS